MSTNKRLGKDQRNKFIKEFEQDGKLSDPNYYAIKDKNGKIQIRRKKPEKTEEEDKKEEVKPAQEENQTTVAKEKKKKTLWFFFLRKKHEQ